MKAANRADELYGPEYAHEALKAAISFTRRDKEEKEIGLMPDAIWQALQDLGKDCGIKHQDRKKMEFETWWIEDIVRRSRGMTKGILFQEYQRRYRIKIKLTEKKYTTFISIKGIFQERPREGNPNASWRKVKPESVDYAAERDFFQKLLQQLAKNHAAQNPPAAATA